MRPPDSLCRSATSGRAASLAAIDLTLDPAQLTELVDTLSDAEGERYDVGGMRTVGR